MKYVLSGYFGFGNAGDDAILAAMVRDIGELDEEAEITVIGPAKRRLGLDDDGGPESEGEAVGAAALFQHLGVHVVARDDWRGVVRAVRKCDLFISGGGGLLQDVTSSRSLMYYTSHLLLARMLRKPRFVYAQGVGPLINASSRRWVKAALRGAVVTVRDEPSADVLARCGIDRTAVTVTADPVFSWADRPLPDLDWEGEGPRKPQLAIIWRSFAASDVGLRLLRPELEEWAEARGLEPVFFAFQPARDVMELRQAGVPREAIVTHTDPARWLEAFAACRLALSVRYHGVLLAALAGVPALGIAYDPKVEALCRQLGLPEPLDAAAFNMADVLTGLEALDREADAWRLELPGRLRHLYKAAKQTARLAVETARGAQPEPEAARREVAAVAEGKAEGSTSLATADGVSAGAAVRDVPDAAGERKHRHVGAAPDEEEPVDADDVADLEETAGPRRDVVAAETEGVSEPEGAFESEAASDLEGRVVILGTAIDAVSLEEAAECILEWIDASPRWARRAAARSLSRAETGVGGADVSDADVSDQNVSEAVLEGHGRLVVTANPELLMQAASKPEVREALQRASLVVADGIGVVWAARRRGRPLPGRVPGIELAEAVMAKGAPKGLRVFLCGSRPGVAPRAAMRLRRRFPGLDIVGAAHGYFTPNEEDELIQRIAASRADVLFLGIGAPRQELWLAEHLPRLGVAVAMGVGGALDVWSGRVGRAPAIMRRTGTEWLWRLLRQPSRVKRMAVLPRFAWRVWRGRS